MSSTSEEAAAGHGEESTGFAAPRSPDAPVELVLSEEQLSVDTQWVRSGVVRLRRRVVTQTRTIEVTLRRTELVIEAEDVEFSADGAGVGTADGAPEPPGQGEPVVIVLAEEHPQVSTVVRPYERVSVTVTRVAEPGQVTAQLAGERAELDTVPRPGANA